MNIQFWGANVPLSEQQKKRVAELLAQRIELLMGKHCSSYIQSVTFCDDISSHRDAYTFEKGVAAEYSGNGIRNLAVRIVLPNEMLAGLLSPGHGQADFDEAILAVQKNILGMLAKWYGQKVSCQS